MCEHFSDKKFTNYCATIFKYIIRLAIKLIFLIMGIRVLYYILFI